MNASLAMNKSANVNAERRDMITSPLRINQFITPLSQQRKNNILLYFVIFLLCLAKYNKIYVCGDKRHKMISDQIMFIVMVVVGILLVMCVLGGSTGVSPIGNTNVPNTTEGFDPDYVYTSPDQLAGRKYGRINIPVRRIIPRPPFYAP